MVVPPQVGIMLLSQTVSLVRQSAETKRSDRLAHIELEMRRKALEIDFAHKMELAANVRELGLELLKFSERLSTQKIEFVAMVFNRTMDVYERELDNLLSRLTLVTEQRLAAGNSRGRNEELDGMHDTLQKEKSQLQAFQTALREAALAAVMAVDPRLPPDFVFQRRPAAPLLDDA